ncbi:MAG: peptidase domain-containing ABC transporter [Chlorobi bacterium]|nr:peptidase domain-containing ABC transporter [Chlorobiota bacterium]
MEELWWSRKCLTLEPNEQFKKADEIKKSRKDWIIKLIKDDYELLGISVILGIVISVLGMAMAVFSQKLVDDILPSKELLKLFIGITLVGFLLIARIAFSAIRQFLLIMQTKNFNNRIIDSFYSSLLYLPKRFFDIRKIGELVARLNDTTRIQRVITQIAGNFIIDLLVSFTSILFLFIYSWRTGIIASLSLPIYFVLVYSFNKKIIDAQKLVMINYAYSESNYVNTMSGITTIKNFNRHGFFSQLNKQIYGLFQEKVVDLGKINIRLGLYSGIFGVVFTIAILAYTSYLVYIDALQVGELIAILGIASGLIPSVGNLALIVIPINEAKVAFNRMFEFTNIKPESNQRGKTGYFNIEQVEVKNLTFRFPGRHRLFENINIKCKRGEFIALVGESGSGKSTLAAILQKFYLPEEGYIRINKSIDLKSLDTNIWRAGIGVVEQDLHIFNGNVIFNICLNDTEEEAFKVLQFLKSYGFDKYIDALPQGYMTLLGEEGINLSGGQKQILALARALYKKPQLLILDEATAAMDRQMEKFAIDLLQKLKKIMAILYISHRLHLLRKISDYIYILENGKIINSGTHEELMKNKNFYSDYWKGMY